MLKKFSIWLFRKAFKLPNINNIQRKGGKGVNGITVLKVSSKSNPNAVAGAITGVFNDKGILEVQCIGAGALNQAVKSIAIARGYVAPSGFSLVCVPAFVDIEMDGQTQTGIKLIVKGEK